MRVMYEFTWPNSPGMEASLVPQHAALPAERLPISVFT